MFFEDIFHATQEIIDKFGLPCNLWLRHHYNYITADVAEIKVILNHPHTFDKMSIYEAMDIIFGNSLLLAPIDVWKKNRKYFAKSFSQPVLNSFVHIFWKKTDILLDVLKDAQNRDIYKMFEVFTLDNFCESIIGIDYNLQTNPTHRLIECVAEMQAIGGTRLLTYFYYPIYLWIFSNEGRRALKMLSIAKQFVYDAIKERRQAFAENEAISKDGTPLPLLDSLIQAPDNKFTKHQIFQEMFLFTTAATDTSGHTLAYFFTMMGMHPHIQEQVYQEVMTVIGSDRPIYSEDLPNLKYTERALFETMRILPVVPFLGRKATKDIEIGTKVLPEGTNIFISVFNLHRSDKYWPDPLRFDPNRFLPSEVAQRDPFTFIPFSGGSRNCIGKTYSIMLMKTCIANVVRNYEISSPYKSIDELKFKSCVTMKTMSPLECTFKSRMHD